MENFFTRVGRLLQYAGYCLALLLLAKAPAFAQQSLTGTSVSQDFNTLVNTGSATWTDNSTAAGWYAGTDLTPTIGTYGANTGSTTAGGLYSFGVAGANPATDRALGFAPSNAFFGASGTGKGYLGWRIQNNTGSTVTTLQITYSGEQWRRDNVTAQTLTFDYQVGTTVTSLTAGTFTAVSGLTFTSPQTGATSLVLDGNAAANRAAGISAIVSLGTPLANGQEIMLRWTDLNDTGNDHFLAVDDVTVAVVAAPPSTTFYSTKVPAGPLNQLGTWSSTLSGSGASPANFTDPNQTFVVTGTGRTIGANWTVSGSGSKAVVDAGAGFTVPAAFNFTGLLDLSAGSALVQQNAAPALTFGSVDAASTVEYGQAGAYPLAAADVPPVTGFGHLTLRNGSKTLPPNTTIVRGNLLVDNVSNFGGPTSAPFATLNLGGNLTLTGTVTFGTAAGRFTVVATNAATAQTFSGNGNTVRLFRLTLGAGQAGVSLNNAGGGTSLELGNLSGGGYSLATGTVLTVDNNTLSFYPLGNASISATGTGQLALSAGSSLVFSKSNAQPLGTLSLTPGSTQLNNLTVDFQGSVVAANITLGLPNSLTVNGTLALSNGILDVAAGNGVALNGPLTTTTNGKFQFTPTSDLAIAGAGSLGTFYFTSIGNELRNLTLNRSSQTMLLGGTLIASGTTTLTAGTLEIGLSNSFNINGPYSITGGRLAGTLSGGSGVSDLSLTGTGAAGDLLFAPGTNYLNNLTLNRTDVPTIQVPTDLYVDNALTLTSGVLRMQGTTRVVVAPGGVVTGGGPNNYVNALTLSATTNPSTLNATLTFPLGLNGNYRPLTLSVRDVTPGGTTPYTARQFEGAPPVRTLPPTLARVSQVRYYNVDRGTGAGTATLQRYSIKLSYTPANDLTTFNSLLRVAKESASGLAWDDLGGTGTGSDITSVLQFSSFTNSDFVLATDINTPLVDNPLPIELAQFSAKRAGAGVQLNWATATERNCAYFDVQRSSTPRDGFGVVGRLDGHGTSATPQGYAFLDAAAPKETVYYRLRQVDFDGTVHYSPVRAVQPAGALAEARPDLQLYPNPTAGALTLQAPSAQLNQAGELSYRVLNALGQPVRQGRTFGTLDVRDLPAGVYFVEVPTETGRLVRRLVKTAD